ncbi:MAG: SpoIIE family protein phosphatase [Planctomycetota bacterium]|nr:SpoIIE family protein phosphatase [Planctomycetota bacterium]MDA1212355.1 SpoIIE family protein phosphatase [Planctomycetota bacterium]
MNRFPAALDTQVSVASSIDPSLLPDRIVSLMGLLETTCQLAALWDEDEILKRVTNDVCAALNCERATLFLYDAASQELYTRVVTQLELREIRLPLSQGVSGWVARERKIANIATPHDDTRWNPDVDQKTGFRTRNILTAPVISAHDGRLCGVLQLLNKPGGPFDVFDEQIIQAYALHAANALERAALWKQAHKTQELQLSLEMGRRIQHGFLPHELPHITDYEIASWWEPAEAVGGDYFDLMWLNEGRLRGAIADVSGHGVGASLIMASARAMWRVLAKTDVSPDQTLNWLADAIADDLQDGRFITMLMAELDVRRHRLTYANAGHGPALIFQAAERKCVRLVSTGLPLGFPGEKPCEPGSVYDLAPGDMVLLATDGLVERRNSAGEYYGADRLTDVLHHAHTRSASKIVEAIKQSHADFSGELPADDDITLLILRRTT